MFDNDIISPLDGLIPAAVSLLVMAIAWRPWKRHASNLNGRWGAPLALGAGFISAFKSINGAWPRGLPPTDVKLWVFWIAIGASLMATLDPLLRLPNWARLIKAMILGAGSVGLMLWPRLSIAATRGQSIGLMIAAGFVAGAWWIAWERSDDTPGDATRLITPLVMFLTSLCVGVLLVMSGSIIYGRFGIALAGAAASIVFIAATTKRYRDRGSAAMALVPVLLSLLAGGFVYADLTLLSLLLCTAAPPLTMLGLRPGTSRFRPAIRILISMILLMLPLGTAIGLATPAFLQTLGDRPAAYAE